MKEMRLAVTPGTLSLIKERLESSKFTLPENFDHLVEEMIYDQEKTNTFLWLEKAADVFPQLEMDMDSVSRGILEDWGLNVDALNLLSRFNSPVNLIDKRRGAIPLVSISLGVPMSIPFKEDLDYSWCRKRNTKNKFTIGKFKFPDIVIQGLIGQRLSKLFSHVVTDQKNIIITGYDYKTYRFDLEMH